MNKARREALEKIAGQLEDAKNDLEMLRDEEQEYMDNMPESLQGGEKYEMAESAVSEMEEAISGLESSIESINNAGG